MAKERPPKSKPDGDLVMFPISPEVARRLDDKDGPDPPVQREQREPGLRTCTHERVSLDMTARHIKCVECAVIIDPVDWIEGLAREWDGYAWRWRDARRKVAAIEKHLAELERLEKNAKARLRNAEHPALKDARLALKQAGEAFWQVQGLMGRLGVEESDSKLYRQVMRAWSLCRASAEKLRPSNATKSA